MVFNLQSLAKIAIQRLCGYMNREHPELSYKTMLPCNLYGKWDKFDSANSHMIPAVIRKLHEAKCTGRDSVEIWGSGKARREFMYAGDLAKFILYTLSHFESVPDLVNVGLGFDYSIDEYYEAVASVVGYEGTFTHNIQKPEGMIQKLVDISRVKALGWQAETELTHGLSITYDYFLEMENAK